MLNYNSFYVIVNIVEITTKILRRSIKLYNSQSVLGQINFFTNSRNILKSLKMYESFNIYLTGRNFGSQIIKN